MGQRQIDRVLEDPAEEICPCVILALQMIQGSYLGYLKSQVSVFRLKNSSSANNSARTIEEGNFNQSNKTADTNC